AALGTEPAGPVPFFRYVRVVVPPREAAVSPRDDPGEVAHAGPTGHEDRSAAVPEARVGVAVESRVPADRRAVVGIRRAPPQPHRSLPLELASVGDRSAGVAEADDVRR